MAYKLDLKNEQQVFTAEKYRKETEGNRMFNPAANIADALGSETDGSFTGCVCAAGEPGRPGVQPGLTCSRLLFCCF